MVVMAVVAVVLTVIIFTAKESIQGKTQEVLHINSVQFANFSEILFMLPS